MQTTLFPSKTTTHQLFLSFHIYNSTPHTFSISSISLVSIPNNILSFLSVQSLSPSPCIILLNPTINPHN